MTKNQFSLLMCVCPDDSINHFNLALRSVTKDQTKKPDEAVLILDGDVDIKVIQIIESVFNETQIKNTIIRNNKQMGLAYSLNRGLKLCSKKWVARMDADDIALPNRFYDQLNYLNSHPSVAVLGTSIREFGDHEKGRDKIAITGFNQIRKTLKYRNPINHPSTIFNRLKILDVGGYPEFKKNQDYALWLILVSRGHELANLRKVLLKFRISKDFYNKRGLRLLKHDIKILFFQKRLGLISIFMTIFLIVIRTFFRALPPIILKLVYSASRKID